MRDSRVKVKVCQRTLVLYDREKVMLHKLKHNNVLVPRVFIIGRQGTPPDDIRFGMTSESQSKAFGMYCQDLWGKEKARKRVGDSTERGQKPKASGLTRP